MSTQQNVNLRGKNGVYATFGDTGHQNIQSSFDQTVHPVPIRFPDIPNTPVTLENIPCAYVVIQNPISNDPIVVGGLGDHTPYRDKYYPGDFRGTLVYPGISYPFFVTNANLLQVVGTPYQTFGYHAYPNVTTVVTTSNVQPDPVDFSRPVLVSSNPQNGATNITTTISPTATFSKQLDPTTVNINSVQFTPQTDGVVFIDNNNTRVGFNPDNQLNTSTTYTLTVKGGRSGITDSTGPRNRLAQDVVIAFTTIPTPDTTPPTVVSVSPADQTANVDTGISAVITMSEALDTATVNTTTCRILDASLTPILSTVTLSPDRKVITIDPVSNLVNNVTHTIRLTTGVKDNAGNSLASQFQSVFTTIPRPSVVSVTPANLATNVVVTTPITIVFSEAMDPVTVTATNLVLLDNNLENVTCTIQISSDQKTVILTPRSVLLNNIVYTVRVKTGVKDLAGISILSQFQSTFTTVPQAAPTVIAIDPAPFQSNVALNAVATVTFSIAMAAPTLDNTSMMIIDPLGGNVPSGVSLGSDQRTVTITPLTQLQYSTNYTINVTTAVRSSGNVPLAGLFQSQFTTAAQSLTQIYQVSGTEYTTLYAGTDIFEGEICLANSILINRIPRRAIFTMRKVGTPPGSITCIIIDTNTGTVLKTIGTAVVATNLGTADTAITFEDASSTQKLLQNYALAVKFSTGDASNNIQVKRSGTNAFDGSNTIRAKCSATNGTGWFLDSARELAATIYE